MCFWERDMPSFDVGVGHGVAYHDIRERIAEHVVAAYGDAYERALTAGGIACRIVRRSGVSGLSLQPEHVIEWVGVFEERTGRKVLEPTGNAAPQRYRCVYHRNIRIL